VASNSTHGYAADRPVSGNTTRYQLNLFPVSLSQTTVPVAIGPYFDGPNLDGLREAHPGVRFLRYSDDGRLIYAWAPNGPVPPIDGFRKATANLVAETRLAAAMVRGALGDRLKARGLTFLGRGAYANFSRGNYLDKVWPGHPPEVGVHPRVLVGTEILEFPEQTPKVFLRVDMEHAVRIDIPVYDLLRQGLTVNGRYVRARAEFTPEYGARLLGRIAHHDENELLLDDTRDGVPIRIAASSCLFEEHRENLLAVVALYDPKLVETVKQDLRRQEDVPSRPRGKADLIDKAVKHLIGTSTEPLHLCDEVEATLGPAVEPKPDVDPFGTRMLAKPLFSYDPESVKTHTVPEFGIRQHGPFSQRRMAARQLRILLLAPERFKGMAERLMSDLQTGVGDGAVFNGMERRYRLPAMDVTKVYFRWDKQPAKDAYYNAATDALREQYDLAFIVIQNQFHDLDPVDNPYHVCKVLFLSQGIPVQEVTVEKLQEEPYDRQYTITTLALASYAKLGGTPYVLRTPRHERQELIFGIGRSVERTAGGRLGKTRQVIGYTTVFGSDGDYLLNSCTAWTDEDNYSQRLEEVVLRSVHEVAAIEGIAEGALVRLIFHVFKRTGRQEREALANVVARLTMYDVEYALVHVNDSHELNIFDHSYAGSERKSRRDALIPPRQLAIDIGTRERLVVLMGPSQYRGFGTFSPLRLELDETSTFRDIDYLAEQVFAFSFMSWRTFNPGVLPATIRYSELMAEMSQRLRSILPWNEDLVRTKLQRKLWFL